MAENEVVINVSADTRAATDNFKRVQNQMAPMQGQVNQLSTGFAQFGKMLGTVGLGGLSVSFAMRTLADESSTLAQNEGFRGFALGQLGPEFEANFAKIEGQLQDVGDEFGFTAEDAEAAWTTIVTTSRDPTAAIEDVESAMAAARVSGEGLDAAAKAVGLALTGNIEPLQEMTGLEQDLDAAQLALIESGKGATTQFDLLGGKLEEIKENFAKVFDDPKGYFADLFSAESFEKSVALKLGLEGVKGAVDIITGQRLKREIGIVGIADEWVTNLFGNMPFVKKVAVEPAGAIAYSGADFRRLPAGEVRSGSYPGADFSRGGGVNITINHPVVDDEISKRALAREIKMLIDEDMRRGIGLN